MSPIDRLFQNKHLGPGAFRFDEEVAAVFDDMIERSVPLYRDVQSLLPELLSLVEGPSVRVVDLGCSTGTSLHWLLKKGPPARPLTWIGVDSSAAMLNRCRESLGPLQALPGITCEFCQDDLRSYPFDDSPHALVIMNYTLQFLEPAERPALLRRAHQALQPDGMLFLSEKLSQTDPQLETILTEKYFEYKRQNGYSELEIARKRDALENVLVPATLDTNQRLLEEAGFRRVELVLKWFNFATWLAFH